MSQRVSTSASPRPRPGFETDLIRELAALIRALPDEAARLTVSREPGHPEWPEPYFEIVPKNSKAASIKGGAVVTDLDLTVGNSWREFCGFASGGTIVRGATWQEELHHIWQAVVAGKLTERLSLDSKDKVIGWDSKLVVNGKELIFRNGRRAERFFGKERVRIVTYEPYIRG